MRNNTILWLFLLVAKPALASDIISPFCRMPNAEAIVLRESAQTYEYFYWLNGQKTSAKGGYKVENEGRKLRFVGQPIEILGPGQRDLGKSKIVFTLPRPGATQVRTVVFSKDQCPTWPGWVR